MPGAACFDARCSRCPRLVAYRNESKYRYPEYHSAPVPAFGDAAPRLLIVGLAPGLHGANRTGRPFTGDHAGILLYDTLHALGLATQAQSASADDPLRLLGVRITNAVKCVPPENKPTPVESRNCLAFLQAELASLESVRAVLALGRIAHDAVLAAAGLKRTAFAFAHGAEHELADGRWLVDSFHCSRYNTQTRRLSAEMFRDVMGRAATHAGLSPNRP